MPPPKYRKKEASNRANCPETDLYPVPDRLGVSMGNHFRPVDEQAFDKIIIEVRDFSLDKAAPQFAAASDAQIDSDDAGDDLIEEKLH
jgi:hypothetical protein